jgi:predicted ArsR family transcriptional regulator
LSDGNLSRHLDVLIRAGLIEASKDSGSGRPRTWLRLTRTGQAALRSELRIMRSLLTIVDLD